MDDITVRIKANGDIIPTNFWDRKVAINQHNNKGDGQLYKCKIFLPREIKYHNHYWLGMTALAFHFGGSKYYWHETFCKMFLPKQTFYNKLLKKAVEERASTAFKKMDQLEFEEYKRQVWQWIAENGNDIQQLIDTM